jgi:hypothetical protein
MTSYSWIGWVAVVVPPALAVVVPAPLHGSGTVAKESPLITIAMKDCPVPASGKKPKDIDRLQLATTFGKEEMAKQGHLRVAGKDYAVYLPKAKSYSLKNTAGIEVRFMNTSSVVFIDQNGDGRLTPDEAWNANQPIRVGDQMFEVVELANDGSKIVLRASRAPLGGIVIGRKCPPFSYKTADGQSVTQATFAGKAFLLDIWSVT